MSTWTDVTRAMKGLPGVTQPKGREWRVGDKLVAWERPLRPADRAALGADAPDGPILAVYAPLDIKDVLLAARPRVYFTTPHFDGWPAILIRLPAISVKELRERLRRSWLERAPKKLIAGIERAKSGGPRRRRPVSPAPHPPRPRRPARR